MSIFLRAALSTACPSVNEDGGAAAADARISGPSVCVEHAPRASEAESEMPAARAEGHSRAALMLPPHR